MPETIHIKGITEQGIVVFQKEGMDVADEIDPTDRIPELLLSMLYGFPNYLLFVILGNVDTVPGLKVFLDKYPSRAAFENDTEVLQKVLGHIAENGISFSYTRK
ncbi:MAG TPA: hypothetical protein VLH19_05565 [Patescibacteria group bacterium]|nr:hypothetical protein [Patescibacteria group bacterium]